MSGKPVWLSDDVIEEIESRSTKDDYSLNQVLKRLFLDEGDTAKQVNQVKSLCSKDSRINVDGIGVGKNVADTLVSEGYDIGTVKVSRNPTEEEDRFRDQKAQFYWYLRELMENGLLELGDNSVLRSQLLSLQYEFSGRRERIKIVDPASSPDYADSLMLCLIRERETEVQSVDNPFAV